MTATAPPLPGPRWRRWSLRVLAGVAILLVLWAGACMYLLATAEGLRTLRDVAQHASHGRLQIQGVRGNLLGGFVLNGVRWRETDGGEVQLAALRLEWTPRALLRGTLLIDALHLDGLQIRAGDEKRSTQSHATGFHLPAGLPLNVQIRSLVVNVAQFTPADGKRFAITHAALRASWIGRKLRLRSLDVTLPQTGPLHLSGSARTEADALEILSLKLTGPG
ncbi:MAG TPA: hypothetical protein VFQ88_12235, partial [Nevskiaceae bacterium]|nr:hypothetical protein [Nevskiaceae bacterium]